MQIEWCNKIFVANNFCQQPVIIVNYDFLLSYDMKGENIFNKLVTGDET